MYNIPHYSIGDLVCYKGQIRRITTCHWDFETNTWSYHLDCNWYSVAHTKLTLVEPKIGDKVELIYPEKNCRGDICFIKDIRICKGKPTLYGMSDEVWPWPMRKDFIILKQSLACKPIEPPQPKFKKGDIVRYLNDSKLRQVICSYFSELSSSYYYTISSGGAKDFRISHVLENELILATSDSLKSGDKFKVVDINYLTPVHLLDRIFTVKAACYDGYSVEEDTRQNGKGDYQYAISYENVQPVPYLTPISQPLCNESTPQFSKKFYERWEDEYHEFKVGDLVRVNGFCDGGKILKIVSIHEDYEYSRGTPIFKLENNICYNEGSLKRVTKEDLQVGDIVKISGYSDFYKVIDINNQGYFLQALHYPSFRKLVEFYQIEEIYSSFGKLGC